MLCINMTQMNPTKGDTELQDICGTVYYIFSLVSLYIFCMHMVGLAIISDMG